MFYIEVKPPDRCDVCSVGVLGFSSMREVRPWKTGLKPGGTTFMDSAVLILDFHSMRRVDWLGDNLTFV